jgi:hypothetical protein
MLESTMVISKFLLLGRQFLDTETEPLILFAAGQKPLRSLGKASFHTWPKHLLV